MTESQIESLVPEGKRFSNLTVAEIDYASKHLGCNVLTALQLHEGEPHPRREMALAWVALVWARRRDPGAQIKTYTDMLLPELTAALGLNRAVEEPNMDTDDPSASPSA